MSGGLFGWIGDGLAEIGNQFTGVFKSDDAASNSGETKGTTTSRNQERGRASYLQGQDLERYTEQQLDEFGLNTLWDENNLVYDETLEKYGKTTQVDVLIQDANDNEVAIIECKAYTSKWNGDDAVDQARRLVSLANERGIPLIFSTYDGTTDCFGSRVKEVLNQTQYFVISSDNIFFADPSDVKENGVTQGLPPELRSHWDWWFGQNYEPKSSCSSDYSSNDPNGFDSSYETESSSRPDYERSDPADSGGSWDLFSNLFGNSSESESSNSSNSSSIDSDSRESSDYGNSDYGSGDYGDSGDSDSSSSSSDSGDSDYGSSDYGSDDYGDSGGSDSSSSSSDSGDSDYGSGDYGDSDASDSSSSSSDSWC